MLCVKFALCSKPLSLCAILVKNSICLLSISSYWYNKNDRADEINVLDVMLILVWGLSLYVLSKASVCNRRYAIN